MMWYLFDSSDGWCIVLEKNVIHILYDAEPPEVGDTATYWYQGKKYEGTVKFKHEDFDEVNKQLSLLKKEAKESKSKNHPTTSTASVSSKRKVNPVTFYGTSASCNPSKKKATQRPKMSEAEKLNQKLLKANKEKAAREASAALLTKLTTDAKEVDNDPDYEPFEDDDSQDSVIADLNLHALKMKQNRLMLLHGVGNSAAPATKTASPTKQALKEEVELLKMKLQVAYDGADKEDINNDDYGYSSAPAENDGVQDSITNETPEGRDNETGKSQGMEDRKSTKSKHDKGGGRKSRKHSSSDEDDLEEEVNIDAVLDTMNHQLYGQDHGDMTLLCKGIYCKTTTLAQALTVASNTSQIMRRLVTGVFRPSQLLDCTVTGQSWRAGGADEMKTLKRPLHSKAVEAIVYYSNCVAKKKGWEQIKPTQSTSILNHKLTEIKDKVKRGLLKD